MFGDLPIAGQLHRWLASFVPDTPAGPGDLIVGHARPGGHAVTVVAFDYAKQHGSIGPSEATQLGLALAGARVRTEPLIFLMNTSGMRVTEGMKTVAALRSLLGPLLDARLAGQRLFATITRHAFGGASMIASLCDRRTMHTGSLLGMSGPKLIESVAGTGALDAADKNAVAALLGGAARAAVTQSTLLSEDSPAAYRAALSAWLDEPAAGPMGREAILARTRELRARLGERVLPITTADANSLAPAMAAAMRKLAPAMPRLDMAGPVFFAHAGPDKASIVCGLAGGGVATAPACLALVEGLLMRARNRSGMAISILTDVASHSADPADERVVLSEYLAHVALTLRWLHHEGNDVHVIVTGIAGGGAFAALSGGASRVSLMPQARLQVLSPAALAALAKRADADDETLAAALAAGAVDSAFGAD